ncbi:lipopolysaccharide biosynthesis protein [Phocaeicola coprocola]|uniref:lipopolysaccharide biosynthesis protein n=1 Tax=Phocaeicola coprocola TaxID=310298 RepID=UPI0029432B5F|nr:lipopolysaccharide biosynthesis protein [Phocaeicola coprocola]
MSSVNDNKRIAKNTIFLYIRTIVVLLVSLYTSRVVLQVLGAEDLGIYNVVGGIVTMMSFFQAAQTKATSRFITYELGKHSSNKILQKVFSVCMTIHIIIAIISLIFGETVGLWIITHWTDIPLERQTAAMWVYQFALIVFCCQIVRVPYDAIVVAHERMSMYAYMSILEAVLLLGMAFLLMVTPGDSLIYYSASVAFIAFIVFLCYYIYVHRLFDAYRYKLLWDKEYSMRILSFSGWTLLGSSANTATQQGTNLLMNNFVGLIANAALGFASQVNIAVSKFVNGFSTAFTPQIIKLYAQKEYESMHILMNRSSKFSFVLCYLMALPLITNMGFILSLWLGNDIPMYTKEFCQLILVCTIFDATTGVYNTTITATGKIKYYQTAISLSFLLDLACCYVLLFCSINPVFVFGSRIMTRGIINMLIGLYFVKSYTHFDILNYSKTVLLNIILTMIISIPPVYFIAKVTDGWICLISTSLVSVLLITICSLYIIMTQSERQSVLSKLLRKFN